MKKYYPASPIVFFIDGLCVFVIVGAICAVVGTFIEKDEPWEICCIIIVAIIMIPLMGSGIASLAWKRILLTPENISVRNDFQQPVFISRVQHAVTVSYSEVTELWYPCMFPPDSIVAACMNVFIFVTRMAHSK